MFLIVGCENQVYKSEYYLNEEAIIDDLYLTLENATYDNEILELNFKITNKRGNTVTISPDDNFKLYDLDIALPNKYINSNNVIKNKDTINYTLQYQVSENEMYDVLFYSGIVENNIKFIIRSSDIK